MTNKAEKIVEEDVECDYCHMEIWGPGVPSGYQEGQIVEGIERSGWMHKRKKDCKANVQEEKYLRIFEDGPDGALPPPTPPPNR